MLLIILLTRNKLPQDTNIKYTMKSQQCERFLCFYGPV